MRDEKLQRFFLILFLKSSNDLRISVPQTPPGNTITLEVIRDVEKSEFEMTQVNMDDPYGASISALNSLLRGVTIEPLRPDLRSDLSLAGQDLQGLVVTAIDSGSPHADSMRVGIVILEINDMAVASLARARQALHKGVNKLWVFDHGNYGFIALRLP